MMVICYTSTRYLVGECTAAKAARDVLPSIPVGYTCTQLKFTETRAIDENLRRGQRSRRMNAEKHKTSSCVRSQTCAVVSYIHAAFSTSRLIPSLLP